VTLCAALAAAACWADVKLPALIGDHMLLQRDAPVRIFGKATPGESVSVAFRGQNVSTRTDTLGRWEVWLQPMKPGPAASMTVRGDNTLTVSDVLVGDVWVGSGQSNMVFLVRNADRGAEEIAAAKWPQIRLFNVARKLSLVPLEDVEGKWEVCSPESIGSFSAVLYFFGRDLHTELKVPMGLIDSAWGGTPLFGWLTNSALAGNDRLRPMRESWARTIEAYPAAQVRYETALAKFNAEPKQQGARPPQPPDGPEHQHAPNVLYNGMIAPLVKYTIRGVTWYQGENDANKAFGHIYSEAMQSLVRDWRTQWGQGDFPFLWVQLANYNPPRANGHWERVQEAQLKATSLKGTGVAVINDIGLPDNIHPTNKQDVGKRLALVARHVAYGQRGFEWMGPTYRQTAREGAALRVWLDHAEGLKTRGGGPVKGFVVAGADRKWVPAEARIEGSTVVVSSPSVAAPVWVRYAWESNPAAANLVNGAGLPASLFRSDDQDTLVVQ
jgi:sialate O-acetylesterase